MSHLFSSLTIAGKRFHNRIVMAPYPSGFAGRSGFIDATLYDYYLERAHGGVGLIITEPLQVVTPPDAPLPAHLGLYDDAFVPGLRHLARAVQGSGARLLAMLEAPPDLAYGTTADLRRLADAFLWAAWRAQAAACDGIALSAADGGALHQLISPLTNHRSDHYGGSATNRLRLALELIEGAREWLGPRLLICFRLIAEEFAPEGISLQDARVNARRLAASGANLLDVTTDGGAMAAVARFPGWRVPLANGIKRVLPDVPVISSGLLGDPQLANSVIEDGSIDMVMLGGSLRHNPYWPHIAQIILASDGHPTLNGD